MDLEERYRQATDLYDAGNFSEAFPLFLSLAEEGYAPAQDMTAHCLMLKLGTDRDLPAAREWYKKAAEQGYVRSQLRLARLYWAGIGGPSDKALANFWLEKAAEQGDAEAQYTLGARYYHGEGVRKNLKRSLYWYTQASEQGDKRAKEGVGIVRKILKDRANFRRDLPRAEAGNPKAMKRIAHQYKWGFGPPKSKKKSEMWYLRAAEAGDVEGMLYAGWNYFCAGDYARARAWYEEAKKRGSEDAKKLIAELDEVESFRG